MKNFIANLKVAAVILGAVALIGGLIWGGFYLKRTVHFNMVYKTKVEQMIDARVAPLEDRIAELEEKLK